MDLNIIHKNKNFIIYKTNDGYIVHNVDMDGFAHSHIKNFNTCSRIIDLSINKKCPLDIPKYLLISLIRVNNDEKFINNLQCLLDNKKNKKYYYNSNKGMRKK